MFVIETGNHGAKFCGFKISLTHIAYSNSTHTHDLDWGAFTHTAHAGYITTIMRTVSCSYVYMYVHACTSTHVQVYVHLGT